MTNIVDVQNSVGNGICEEMFMNSNCDYDGGDCCPYEIINDPSFGDGRCDDRMNTRECGYDDGDCLDCPIDSFFGPSFGDGQCNGGIASTAQCVYDNGDCDDFITSYPDCPLVDISLNENATHVVIGDGICDSIGYDSDLYNTTECGHEYGDCVSHHFYLFCFLHCQHVFLTPTRVPSPVP